MRSGFRKKWDDMNLKVESTFRKLAYRRKAKIRLKKMNGGFLCDKEYKEIVLPYWRKYGYRPKKLWYQIFSERDGVVDPRYIPDDLYYGELVPYFSNSQFRRACEDKCYHDVWFPELKQPETVIKNIAGVYYDREMRIISMDEAIDICMAYPQEFLLKPSVDSGEGRLITFFDPAEVTREALEKAFRAVDSNFLLQAAVKQHPVLAQMNPTSLNTIRVVSFLFEGEVHILSQILRMGAPEARVDNVGAGGFACPIHPDGRLYESGVNRQAEWKTENHNGIMFANVEIPYYNTIIEAIRQQHKRIAHFKLIGWDFSIDESGDPVFIEYNVCPGSNQITCGPTFGDLTERVLEEYFIKRTLKNAQN